MTKVLVTGGAGFVGRHLVKRLLDRGAEVHCVDSIVPLTGGIDVTDGWPLFEPRDYRNFRFYREDCRTFFDRVRDTDFDETFHLAAVVGGREMIERRPLAVADDLAIDAGFWQWAEAVRPAKIVNFSSSAAYPVDEQRAAGHRLLREDMIDFERRLGVPDMSYGWAKLTHEYLGRLAYQRHGLKSVVYRPFSGYGEDQDDSYPFPSICKRVLRETGKPQIKVWGSGRQMRDFIHIEDCLDGVFQTKDQVEDGSAVNLSTGILTSFIDFTRTVAAFCGYEPEVVGSSDKPEGVFARGGDTTLQRSLGFTHKVSFAEGIRLALTHYSRSHARGTARTMEQAV